MPLFHLAQINVSRMRAPLTDPSMASFVAQFFPLSVLAEKSPGFVRRLLGAGGYAANTISFEDDILVNMSVWEGVEPLRNYVYKSQHAGPMRSRRQWFLPFDGPAYALWWIPVGHKPTTAEGKERLAHIAEQGNTTHSFTFQHPFPAPETLLECDRSK